MSRAIVSTVIGSGMMADDRIDGVKSPSFFARIASSIRESRERAASREIAKFIEMNGGQLTDSMEREISRRYGRSSY